jgi:ATP-binding cassette subfamily B protein
MTEKKQKGSLARYWDRLIEYLRYQRGRVILLAILSLSAIAIKLINPQIVSYFLDAAESGTSFENLITAGGIFMGLAILGQVLQILVTYLGENVAWTATNMLRADLALHCLKLDMSFHKKYKPGELIERVDGDINQLTNFFSQMVIRLGSNLLLIIGVLVLLWVQNWAIGLSITAATFAGRSALNYLNKIVVPLWQAVRESEAQLFGYVEEWLNGTEEIQTSGAKAYIMLRLFHALRNRWQKILKAMRIDVLVSDLPVVTFSLAYVAAHIVGSTLFRDSQITIGQLYIVFYYIDVLKGPLWELLHQIEDLQRAAASINRVAELRTIQPTILDGEGVEFTRSPLGVQFNQVTFQYEDDMETDILKQIDFSLQPGKVLGLLGRTGSGKSTLTKLLFRFHDPSAGSIEVWNGDGCTFDLKQATLSQLRENISMVTQEVQLFNASVRQNLTLFDDSIPEKQIVEVVEDVGLGEWYQKLPDGLETRLDSEGSGLSAGESQLLAFGRIFLTNPGLVIMDEASSRLDPATEHQIERAVDKLLEQRTGIIIAHRLNTVQRADEIIILEDGEIAEHGKREKLVADPNSLFYQLLQTGMEEALA